jgi:hypothetical protein
VTLLPTAELLNSVSAKVVGQRVASAGTAVGPGAGIDGKTVLVLVSVSGGAVTVCVAVLTALLFNVIGLKEAFAMANSRIRADRPICRE